MKQTSTAICSHNFIFIDTKTFAAMASFYSLSATKTDGSTFEMKDCVGKVVYATNVASKWSITKYERDQFKSLGKNYGDELIILAFPGQGFCCSKNDDNPSLLKPKNTPGNPYVWFSTTNSQLFLEKAFPEIQINVLSDDDSAQTLWKLLLSQANHRDPTASFNGTFLVAKDGAVLIPTNVQAQIESLV